jgi:hypothetical protein
MVTIHHKEYRVTVNATKLIHLVYSDFVHIATVVKFAVERWCFPWKFGSPVENSKPAPDLLWRKASISSTSGCSEMLCHISLELFPCTVATDPVNAMVYVLH